MKLLQEELVKRGLDCAIFLNNEGVNPNLFYLIGYVGSGALVVRPNDKPILHVPARDLTEAKKINGVIISSGKKLVETLTEYKIRTGKIGIDFSNVSVRDFNNLKESLKCEFFDVSEFMELMRVIKNDLEIDKIRKACKITDNILNKFVKNFKKFKTEEEAGAFLVYETRLAGCDIAFELIVASGVNAAVPHHKSKGKINNGFCVVDFGIKFKGYCSDITRTIYFGVPSKSEEKKYYDLLMVQEKAISLVKDGALIREVCSEAETLLVRPLIHSLGHGLGIEVHEKPYVSTNSKDILKEGMVITIEPGDYVEGKYGIRIEDDVLVTSSGCEILSKFSKRLIIIDI